MSVHDPVADMLTCIRNAQMMGIVQINLPYSNLKIAILRVMQEEGYIEGFEIIELTGNKKDISVNLKYYQGRPVIDQIHRVSRPGLRVYKGCDEIPKVRGGLGIAILSTPKGVMADRVARVNHVGGEILCTVE